jgi:hypothetical protein
MTLMTNRQTGRTQRMLEVSVEEARRGEYVIVLANDERQIGQLYDRLMTFEGAEPTNRENGKVYFPGGGSVSVINRHEGNVDMRRGINIGVHPSVILHADHFAAENFIREQAGWALTQTWDASDDQGSDTAQEDS